MGSDAISHAYVAGDSERLKQTTIDWKRTPLKTKRTAPAFSRLPLFFRRDDVSVSASCPAFTNTTNAVGERRAAARELVTVSFMSSLLCRRRLTGRTLSENACAFPGTVETSGTAKGKVERCASLAAFTRTRPRRRQKAQQQVHCSAAAPTRASRKNGFVAQSGQQPLPMRATLAPVVCRSSWHNDCTKAAHVSSVALRRGVRTGGWQMSERRGRKRWRHGG